MPDKKLDPAVEAGFDTLVALIDDLRTQVGNDNQETDEILQDLDEQVGRLLKQARKLQSRLVRAENELSELAHSHAALCQRVDRLGK